MDTNLVEAIVRTALSEARDGTSTIIIAVAIIAAIPSTLAAILAYVQAKTAVKGVREVHLAINSRMDKWLKIESDQGVAKGRLEGRAAERVSRKQREKKSRARQS